ncbi:Sodium- and chloride-dependent GABA transporter 2 [Larimichthys crocea]|uniref:Uncharacterized protein n=1 Tax=Larimichthys crocea TaxID=215358 RepID=A0ACD3RJ61_LARCR|nr:Sodium- and chloride-dependent GABA transporter 2 [Larimichthys crocea]
MVHNMMEGGSQETVMKCEVVYFTATFPYAMLLVLLVRGLTLPGAMDGLAFYLYPDPTRLVDPQVWMDAGAQVLFSFGICQGSLTALGSYNQYNNDCYKDTFVLCLVNGGSSFVAGFAIFSVLGFMSYEQGLPISEVAASGPGLAFIAYPRAVAMMPLPQLWSICFFIMVILLGADTQFVSLECPDDLGDRHVPHCVSASLSSRAAAAVSLLCLLLSRPPSCHRGADHLYDNIEDMIGYRPWPVMKYCWLYITPLVCLGTFIFSVVKYKPLKFNKTYIYPAWAYALGWSLGLFCVLLVPLWIIFKMAQMKGTVWQKLRQLCQPEIKTHNTAKRPEQYPLNPDNSLTPAANEYKANGGAETTTSQTVQERGKWGSKKEFILSVAGAIIGLGNVLRFPYLCYKNGGGAFFIPYILLLVTCGIPLFTGNITGPVHQ